MTLRQPDRRQFGRRQTTAYGWIHVEGRPRVPCAIANISIGGALLQVDKPSWLPFRFRLVVESLGIDSMCEVRHQRDNAVGISFLKPTEHDAATQRERTGRFSTSERATWTGKH